MGESGAAGHGFAEALWVKSVFTCFVGVCVACCFLYGKAKKSYRLIHGEAMDYIHEQKHDDDGGNGIGDGDDLFLG